jgi:dipeptidyl aminopeptidase/acylaminoacyl peptidase
MGDPVPLTDALDEDATYVSATANELLVEAQAKTAHGLYRIPLAQGKPSGPPQRVSTDRYNSGFQAAGGTIAFISETSSEPPDVFASTGATFNAKRLTSTNPQAAAFGHGAQRVVTWKSSADSESIEGVLSLPLDTRKGHACRARRRSRWTRGRVRGALSVGQHGVSSPDLQQHGIRGPAAELPRFNSYGQRFRGLNKGDILGKDWIDVKSGVDAMIRTGVADSTKMGLMGWSYGGSRRSGA